MQVLAVRPQRPRVVGEGVFLATQSVTLETLTPRPAASGGGAGSEDALLSRRVAQKTRSPMGQAHGGLIGSTSTADS